MSYHFAHRSAQEQDPEGARCLGDRMLTGWHAEGIRLDGLDDFDTVCGAPMMWAMNNQAIFVLVRKL
jgi:hypothetical protein